MLFVSFPTTASKNDNVHNNVIDIPRWMLGEHSPLIAGQDVSDPIIMTFSLSPLAAQAIRNLIEYGCRRHHRHHCHFYRHLEPGIVKFSLLLFL